MEFIETSIFSRKLKSFLTDDEYFQLQNALINRPDTGKIIQGSGGLRKLRWAISGKGKQSGVRVIYYWLSKKDTIIMLLIYGKNEQDELTSDQMKTLKSFVIKELA